MKFYPGYRSTDNFPAWPKHKEFITCTVCKGKGDLPDAKTKIIRQCVACNGSGKIKRPEKQL